MLTALTDFVRRWADDISRYGFLGALMGAVPQEPGLHGRAAVAMRGTPAQHRLTQSSRRASPFSGYQPAVVTSHNADDEWGPGSGLSQRREPTL